MIDDEDTWKENFALIPQDPTGALAPLAIATFVTGSVTLKLDTDSSAVKFSPQPLYTWIQVSFQSALAQIAMVPSPVNLAPAIQIGSGWAQSTTASQLIITPGASMNPPPTGTNGIAAVAVAVIDPLSVTKATADLIKELAAAPPATDPLDAILPVAVRKAFLGLRFLISGIDTTPTPAGPIPFSITAKVV